MSEFDSKTLPEMRDMINGLNDIGELRRIATTDERKGVQGMARMRIGEVVADGDPREGMMAARSLTPDEMVLAQLSEEPQEKTESIFANDANAAARKDGETGYVTDGKVTTRNPGKVRLFKPDQDGTYIPVDIPRGNVSNAVRDGMKALCPYCNKVDCRAGLLDRRLKPATAYDCPELPKRQFMRCPVCVTRKKFYDPLDPTTTFEPGEVEEGEIASQAYAQATPQARIEARIDRHMIAFHPEEARVRGIRETRPDPMLTEQARTS